MTTETKSVGNERLRQIDEEISAYFRTESAKQWKLIDAHCKKQRAEVDALKEKLRNVISEDEMRMVSFPCVQHVLVPPTRGKV